LFNNKIGRGKWGGGGRIKGDPDLEGQVMVSD